MALPPYVSGIVSRITESLTEFAETAAAAAQAWAEGTLPGGPGTKSAKEYAQDSAASVGAVKQLAECAIQNDTILVTGAWYSEFFAPVATTFTGFKAWVYLGTGTVDVRVNVNGSTVDGPRTVSTSVTTATPSITVAAGDSISFQLSGITGTPKGIAIQLVGLPV